MQRNGAVSSKLITVFCFGENSNVNLTKHSQCYWITGKASNVIVMVVFFLLHLWKINHGVLDIYDCVESKCGRETGNVGLYCTVLFQTHCLQLTNQHTGFPLLHAHSHWLKCVKTFFFFLVSFPCLPVEGGISLGNVLHSWQLESSCQVRLPHSVLRPLSYSVVDQQIALRET